MEFSRGTKIRMTTISRRIRVFKLIAERLPDEIDLASRPTISRLENAVTVADLLRMEDWLSIDSSSRFRRRPSHLTLDVDLFDDPAHGNQQLTLFHGFYDQYQYQVRVITCAENDLIVLPALLFGTACASLGTATDLRRVIHRLRDVFPTFVFSCGVIRDLPLPGCMKL